MFNTETDKPLALKFDHVTIQGVSMGGGGGGGGSIRNLRQLYLFLKGEICFSSGKFKFG